MFCMPVIPSDLRHEETIIQAANAIEHLQNILVSVFDKINARIENNNKKINSLGDRIESANNKINKLIGINKAIQIFSPSKFPSSSVFVDIPLTFYQNGDLPQLKWNKEYEIKSGLLPINSNSINDKLVFFHVRNNKDYLGVSKIVDNSQGLGKIPSNIKSVNSLLLYNTSINVYTDLKQVDLFGVKKEKNKIQNKVEPSQIKIESAPLSITNRQHRDTKLHQGLFYTPKLNDAPEIDLPIDLPDLPGIADDVQFRNIEHEEIAPSLFIDNLPDLPTLDDTDHLNSEKTCMPPTDKLGVQQTAILPPKPPPAPPSQPNVMSTLQIAQPLAPRPQSALPTALSLRDDQTKASDVTDVRSTLMESIRNAGKTRAKKLLAAEDLKRDSNTKSEATDKPVTGDLMADLRNNLTRRRIAISGAINEQPVNVMDRISSLIPPPPKPAMHSTTDDEDDDKDGWDD